MLNYGNYKYFGKEAVVFFCPLLFRQYMSCFNTTAHINTIHMENSSLVSSINNYTNNNAVKQISCTIAILFTFNCWQTIQDTLTQVFW